MNTKNKRSTSVQKYWFSWFVRTSYYAILSALWVGLIVQIYNCVQKYISEPTYYNTEVKAQKNAEFPEITLCPYLDKDACMEEGDSDPEQIFKSLEWFYQNCGLEGKLSGEWHKQLPCAWLRKAGKMGKENLIKKYPTNWQEHFPQEWVTAAQKFPPCKSDPNSEFLKSELKYAACQLPEENVDNLKSPWYPYSDSDYKLADFVSSISITTRDSNKKFTVFKDGIISKKHIAFKMQKSTEFGTCQAILLKRPIRSAEISVIEIRKT